jgi:hypothetical protein
VTGGCERILRTPVPLSYSRHNSRFLIIWLTLLPFTLWDQVSPGRQPRQAQGRPGGGLTLQSPAADGIGPAIKSECNSDDPYGVSEALPACCSACC